MFEDYLNHRCDIYHTAPTDTKIGYGINAARVAECPKEPDITDVPCHFHINTGLAIAGRTVSEAWRNCETHIAIRYGDTRE